MSAGLPAVTSVATAAAVESSKDHSVPRIFKLNKLGIVLDLKRTAPLPPEWGCMNTTPLTARDIQFHSTEFNDLKGEKCFRVFYRILHPTNVDLFFENEPLMQFLTDCSGNGCYLTLDRNWHRVGSQAWNNRAMLEIAVNLRYISLVDVAKKHLFQCIMAWICAHTEMNARNYLDLIALEGIDVDVLGVWTENKEWNVGHLDKTDESLMARMILFAIDHRKEQRKETVATLESAEAAFIEETFGIGPIVRACFNKDEPKTSPLSLELTGLVLSYDESRAVANLKRTEPLPPEWGSMNPNPLTARDIQFLSTDFNDLKGEKCCSVFFRILHSKNVDAFFKNKPLMQFLTDRGRNGCHLTLTRSPRRMGSFPELEFGTFALQIAMDLRFEPLVDLAKVYLAQFITTFIYAQTKKSRGDCHEIVDGNYAMFDADGLGVWSERIECDYRLLGKTGKDWAMGISFAIDHDKEQLKETIAALESAEASFIEHTSEVGPIVRACFNEDEPKTPPSALKLTLLVLSYFDDCGKKLLAAQIEQ
jgi:hypothetical protein